MNEIEQRKFRKSYDDEDFSKCMNDQRFQKVWESGTLEEAGSLATDILKGGARTRKEGREKDYIYRLNKEYR